MEPHEVHSQDTVPPHPLLSLAAVLNLILQLVPCLIFWFFFRSRAKVSKVAGEPMTETTSTTVIMNPKMEHVVEVIQTDANGALKNNDKKFFMTFLDHAFHDTDISGNTRPIFIFYLNQYPMAPRW